MYQFAALLVSHGLWIYEIEVIPRDTQQLRCAAGRRCRRDVGLGLTDWNVFVVGGMDGENRHIKGQ